MNRKNEIASLSARVRKLTSAITILSVLVAISLILSIRGLLVSSNQIEEGRYYSTSQRHHFEDPKDQYAGFHQWPIEKQIEESTLVLMCRYEEKNGKIAAVISEIFKMEDGINIELSVGDVIESHITKSRGGDVGDGMIAFYVGEEPSQRSAIAIHGTRVPAYSGFSLEDICNIIRKAVSEQVG